MMIGQSLFRPGFVARPGFMPARPRFVPPVAPPPPAPPPPAVPPGITQRGFPPSWNARLIAQRNLVQQREFNRLLRENTRLSREQAAIMAQQAAAQQVPNVPAPTSPPPPAAPISPQVPTQPSGPAADLTPTQDAAENAAAASAPEPPPTAHKSHLLLFVGIAVAAGVGGYVLIKHKKKAKAS